MPELPEVEATVCYLRERIVGTRVSKLEVLWHRTLAVPSRTRERLISQIARGAPITAVTRRGKFVVIHLGAERRRSVHRKGERPGAQGFMLFHLRMSGSLDVLGAHLPRATHDRLIVSLDNGKELRFHDPRKFGRAYLVSDHREVTGDLGPEPLGSELSSAEFSRRIVAHRGALKPLLLNQRVIAGLGNIYVDEALWRARLHPTTPAAAVPVKRLCGLFLSIQEVLTEAIKHQGTDFGDGVVVYGGYRPQVYGRAGEPCARCGALIVRMVVGQRGTHFCPRCQRDPPRSRSRKSSQRPQRTDEKNS